MASTEVVIAGFGGQGVLLSGKILAQAGMDAGMHVSWLPSYGPEMRGGTANVAVCLSDAPVGSPLITKPRALLAFNLPSLDKFASQVRPGGLIVINSSLIERNPERMDCRVVRVGAREISKEAGNDRASNFVILGAFIGATGIVSEEDVEKAIAKEFQGRKAKFVPSNIVAFRAGVTAGRGAETSSQIEAAV